MIIFWVASQHGQLSIVKCLLNHGADVNKATTYGSTPLSIASRNEQVSVVDYLVSHGADVSKAGCDGLSPPSVSSGKGRGSVVHYLASDEEAPKSDGSGRCREGWRDVYWIAEE